MATGITPHYSLSYPLSIDPVNVASDIEELAQDIDGFLHNPSFNNNVDIDGGSITTTSLTANVFNSNSTTLNIGGAATILNIGATAGQVNVRGNLNIGENKVYEINDITVLSSSALGSNIVSSNLASLGNITSGTWSATTIAVDKGGTGLTSYTIGDIIYASGSASLQKLAGTATGNSLISGGVGAAPSWGKIGLTTHVSGTLPVANGGTGITSFGTGIATWLGTPSSANLAAAVTDETGSGSLVFSVSPTFTGTPTSTTAAMGTNTTQIATTAFVLGQANSASATITMNGIQSSGSSDLYARADHIHPIDTSRAPLASPTFTGTVSSEGTSIVMSSATSGSPSNNASFKIERGTSLDVEIRWNEATDFWEFTNDGTIYKNIGSTETDVSEVLSAALFVAGL